jgi:hypothetical protein
MGEERKIVAITPFSIFIKNDTKKIKNQGSVGLGDENESGLMQYVVFSFKGCTFALCFRGKE